MGQDQRKRGEAKVKILRDGCKVRDVERDDNRVRNGTARSKEEV